MAVRAFQPKTMRIGVLTAALQEHGQEDQRPGDAVRDDIDRLINEQLIVELYSK